ncbi:hypothetical protein ACGFIX_18790 [Nocardia salmonicida]|uniref:hypothetical protein n=1 Tax=Nocardia salmonicida TaxID=53431 RepID=UPI003715FDF9
MVPSIDEEQKRINLLASVNRAMSGSLPSVVRAVFCKDENSQVFLRFVVDGEISDDDWDSVSCIGAEVIADFSAPYMIDESIERLDVPANVATPQGWLVAFLRNEPGAEGGHSR